MIFLSTLLRQHIYDIEGHKVGVLRDVCVSLNETFPTVTALVITTSTLPGNNDIVVPWSQVVNIEDPKIYLTVKQQRIASYAPHADELLLKRDLLDKQIVDTQGFRVIKANDLKLAQIKETARLIGVDISGSGLLRRLGILAPFELVSRALPFQFPERIITWNYVEPIEVVKVGTTQLALAGAGAGTAGVVPQVQLSISHNKLSDLHPADIADILEQLDIEEAGAVLDRMDTETAADILNEVEAPLQFELLSELDPEKASDLLEKLAPDDAADILAELPQDKAERLLGLMPAEESRPIRELLRYAPETAGGIMTTEVLSLSQELTVEEALVYMRQNSAHLEMIYYLFIVDDEKHLVGVVSLRELVVAEPTTRLKDIMDDDVIKVKTDADQEEVARIISKYDLLGVPVVDEENRLVGLRSPLALSGMICFIPMLMLTSGSVGSQALGVAGWQLRSVHGTDFWRGMFREIRIGTVGGVLATIIAGMLAWLLFHSWLLGIAIGLGLGFSLLLATICGLVLPTLFQRLRMRGSLLSAPLIDPTIAVISLSFFLLVALWLIDMLHV